MAAKFEQHYKKKPIGFANVEESRYLRAEAHLKTRRRHRANVFNENRDISNSPNPESEDTEAVSTVTAKESRMTRLQRWKTERDKRRKIEQIQKRPAFVVGVVHHRVYSPISKDNNVKEPPLLTKVQKKVATATFPKGITKATEKRLANKTIAKQLTKGTAKNSDCTVKKDPKKHPKQEHSIAPDDYPFKAPPGLPPMLFGRVAIESMSPYRMSDLMTFSPMTKRASRKSSIPRFIVENITSKKLNTPAKDETTAKNIRESSVKDISLKLSSSDDEKLNLSIKNERSNNSNNEIKVEEKNSETPANNSTKVLCTPTDSSTSAVNCNSPSEPVFFSPYVVSSRGKSNARKEQQLRRGFSLGGSSSNEVPMKDTVMKDLNISVEEEQRTARYFQFLLNRETDRLNELCRKWAEIKDDPEIIEDAQYQINQAIGQTNLLINKKFGRFRSLVSDCETGKGEMLVTCKDLQGFWDMMYMEVKNCDLRFEKLEKLCSQNWKEDEEEAPSKPIGKRKTTTRKKMIAKKPSSIRSFLAENKKRMAQKMKDGEDTEQFHITENHRSDKAEKNETSSVQCKTRRSTLVPGSDKKFTPAKQKGARLSLLRAVQLSETKIPSPLAVIKVSQMWKTPEVQLDNSISYVNSDQTPGRSILKQPKSTTDTDSTIKSIQKVNFDDNVCSNQIPVDEETQLKRDLAAALARIDSLDLDLPREEASISVGKKLTFDDDSSEESEDVHGIQQISEVKDSKSKSLIEVPSITVQIATPKNILRKSLRRQNAVEEISEKSDGSSSDNTNEHDKNVRVLRSRRITSVDTPKPRRKSLRRASTNVKESEHKENKSPSKIRRKSSLKSRMNDSKRINSEVELKETVNDISSNESSKRRYSSRTVKFAEKDCNICTENKATLSMTPHVRRNTMESSDKKRKSTSKQKQASFETPIKPPERVRRSQIKRVQNS